MSDFLAWSMVAFSGAGLLAGSGALLAIALEWWATVPGRWRLIRDAYSEGFRDGEKSARKDKADE